MNTHQANQGPDTAEVSTQNNISPRERMISIRVAVRPDLTGPLRGVCVDLDLNPRLGQLMMVGPPFPFKNPVEILQQQS